MDLGEKQREIIASIQKDEGYLAHLGKEIKLTKERLAAGRGKLDLIAELALFLRAEHTATPPVPIGDLSDIAATGATERLNGVGA